YFPAPRFGEKVGDLVKTETLRELVQVDARHTLALQLFFHELAPFRDRSFVIQAVKPLPHLAARTGALQITERRIQPVTARAALLGCDYLDLLSIGERCMERNHCTIDARATAPVTEITVHAIRKIDRRRIARQI